jgi:adenosylcobinamide-GDP ribazoletransferase
VSARRRAAGALRARGAELLYAAIFLTRLPIPWPGVPPAGLFRRSLPAFPVVGALIGAAGGAVLWAGLAAGLPAGLAALAGVAAQILLTGALHEDGLADMADGLGGGRTREDKLAIMRDSRLGSYGALALGLATAARVLAAAALAGVDPRLAAAALVAAGAASRAVPAVAATLLPPARADGLAAEELRPGPRIALSAGLIGGGLALAALAVAAGPVPGVLAGLAALGIGGLAAALPGRLAARQVGGYTGDVLGACQQAVEIAMLVTLAAAA